eukprot:3048162-Amphidinium_carterae.1
METSELRQGSRHIWVSRAKTPLLIRQCLLQLQPLSSQHLLQMLLHLNRGKMLLHNKYMGVLCTQAAGLKDLQGALDLFVR